MELVIAIAFMATLGHTPLGWFAGIFLMGAWIGRIVSK